MRVIKDNKELQGVMRASRGSQESTRSYRGFQLVKGGLLYYWWLQGLLGITGGFYLIWNYSGHFLYDFVLDILNHVLGREKVGKKAIYWRPKRRI